MNPEIQSALDSLSQGVMDGDAFRSALQAATGGRQPQVDSEAVAAVHRSLGYVEIGGRWRSIEELKRSGWTEADNLSANFTAHTSPEMVTSIRKGRSQYPEMLGQYLFRTVATGKVNYQYRVYDLSHFALHDTRRGPSAPFGHVRRNYSLETGSLERRGLVALLDRDEIRIAESSQQFGLDVRTDYALLARNGVEMDLENERATMILDTGNYAAGLSVTETTAWDAAGGDSYATIRSLADNLAGRHNRQPEEVGVVLTRQSVEAAYGDPTFKATRSGINQNRQPSMEELRTYWGVGEVTMRDASFSSDNATLSSLYGDIAVGYLMPGRMAGPAEREDSMDHFVEFSWNAAGGLALSPEYIGVQVQGVATSWLFPWESWSNPAVVATDGAFIVKNTKA